MFEAEPEAGEAGASFATLHGLYWLALNLAAERPLLLAVDDLHWCDRPSLRFLAYLARRLDGAPVLLATTLRSNEPPTDPALLGEIVNDPATLPLRPGPLSEPAVADLVRERLGADADAAFCAACHAATGGNPLLLRQLLRALEAEGVRPEAAQSAVVRAIGPRAVSGTVLLRLARQSADARAVARAAAVLGESAALPAVAVLARLDERATAAATGELIRAEILRPDPPLGFVHPLVRDAVYHEIPPAERELEHEAAATVLRDGGRRHRARGRAAARDAAARCGVGDRPARARGGRRVAQGRGGQRGRVPAARARGAAAGRPAPERADRARHRRGDHERSRGGAAPAARRYDATDRSDRARPDRRGAVPGARVHGLRDGGVGRRRATRRRRCTGLDDPRPVSSRARWSRWSSRRTSSAAAARSCSTGSPPYRHPPAEPGPAARAIAGIAAYDWANRDGTAEEAAALALSALDDGVLQSTGNGLMVIIATATLVLADRPEALASLETLEAEAHRRGSLLDICSVQLWIGYTLLVARAARGGRGADPGGVRRLRCSTGSARCRARTATRSSARCSIERGDVPGARAALERSHDFGDVSDASRHWLHARTRAARRRGPLGGGAGGQRGVRAALRRVPRVARQPMARAPRGGARPARAHRRGAPARERRPGARARVRRARATSAARCACSAGSSARTASRGSRRPSRCWPAAPARLEHAKALLALGSALRLARRPGDAREPLRQALELASACGAPPLADAARSELYAAGARPRTEALSGLGALTASERRVVDLAAAGETNRDIAQALYVTPKTVEVHLSNAYRKLGIRSRRELPEALAS